MAQTDRNGEAPGQGRSGKARARREAKARARWEREAERRIRLCYAVEVGGEGHGLTLPEVQTLQQIAVGERTWTPTETLAQVGLNGSTLAGLVASGWVEEFQTEDGPCVTLSSWSAEVLRVDSEERWETLSGPIDQEDSSGERTRSHVRLPQEVPRFEAQPPPPEPGMPRPKPKPIKLPFLFRMSRLPDDVIQGILARTVADPVDEAMANEEHERYLEREARTESGSLDVDPSTGQIRMEPVTLWAPPAEDEFRGGLNDTHGGKIPIAKPRGRPSKKKRRKRKRSA
jgi:hypothetical protein